MTEASLPEAELDVLSSLRHRGEATAREIREDLESRRPMTHAAVFNLLKRLEERGLVTRRKGDVGKAFVYKPRVPAEGVFRRLTRDLVDRAFGGDSVALMNSLFETRPPSKDELKELEALVARLRKENKRGGSSS